MMFARRRVLHKRLDRLRRRSILQNAARVLQRSVREYLYILKSTRLKQALAERARRNDAAMLIQGSYRIFIANRRFRLLRSTRAVVKVQRVWRGFLERMSLYCRRALSRWSIDVLTQPEKHIEYLRGLHVNVHAGEETVERNERERKRREKEEKAAGGEEYCA